MRFVYFFAFLSCFYSFSFSYSFSVNFELFPGDEKFLIFEGEEFVFIFPEEYKKSIPLSIKKYEVIRDFYKREFQWTLDSKIHILFTSPKSHLVNAFASVFPDYRNVFFNGSVHSFASIGALNLSSFMDLLLVHEVAHIYQFSPKPTIARGLFKIFRNSLDWSILFFPNVFTSTFMIEGNATYNESRMKFGGRLFSPINRALFFSLVKGGKIRPTRLNTNHYFFPGLSEKYIVGAYFNEFLHSQYKNPNLFFMNQARRWYLAFLTNPNFNKTFGKNFNHLVLKFESFYLNIALQQKEVLSPALAQSFFPFELNKSKDEVFFITNRDLRSKNEVNIYSIDDGSFKKRGENIPGGKLFILKDGQLYSRSTGAINWKTTQFALFRKGWRLNRSYLGKYVFDQRGGNTLFAFADQSGFEVKAYLNDKEFGSVYTSPLLDDFGNVYDFKQEGEKSFLVKNQKRVFSLDTYFPKLVDVSADGNQVFFIGATLNGSSLFMVDLRGDQKRGQRRKNKDQKMRKIKKNRLPKVYRLSKADTLVDAKQIKKNQFFVTQVTNKGYSYHVMETLYPLREEKPYKIEYASFKEKKNLFHLFSTSGKLKNNLNGKSEMLKRAYNKKDEKEKIQKSKSRKEKDGKKKSDQILGPSILDQKGVPRNRFQTKKRAQERNKNLEKPPEKEGFYDFKRYDAFRFIEYKRGTFLPTYINSNNYLGVLDFYFADPLLYHNINTQLEMEKKSTKENQSSNQRNLDLKYSYRKYRFKLGFGYNDQKFKIMDQDIEEQVKDSGSVVNERGFYIFGDYPFFRIQDWSMHATLSGKINHRVQSDRSISIGNYKITSDKESGAVYRLKNRLILMYDQKFLFSFHSYRKAMFSYLNELIYSTLYDQKVAQVHALNYESAFDLGLENFILSYLGFIHLRTDSLLNYKGLISDSLFYLLSSDTFATKRNTDFLWGSLYYKKVINWTWYSRFFFIGLNRLAPYSMVYGHKKWMERKEESSYLNYSVGIDLELIFAGKFPFHLEIFTKRGLKEIGWSLRLSI